MESNDQETENTKNSR